MNMRVQFKILTLTVMLSLVFFTSATFAAAPPAGFCDSGTPQTTCTVSTAKSFPSGSIYEFVNLTITSSGNITVGSGTMALNVSDTLNIASGGKIIADGVSGSCSYTSTCGQAGGVLKINASTINLNGSISANGGNGCSFYTSAPCGGLPGGTVNLVTNLTSGSGSVSASGGGAACGGGCQYQTCPCSNSGSGGTIRIVSNKSLTMGPVSTSGGGSISINSVGPISLGDISAVGCQSSAFAGSYMTTCWGGGCTGGTVNIISDSSSVSVSSVSATGGYASGTGGSVYLKGNNITLGTITAAGSAGYACYGYSSGGGPGGSITILSNFTSISSEISTRGGNTGGYYNYGGSGGPISIDAFKITDSSAIRAGGGGGSYYGTAASGSISLRLCYLEGNPPLEGTTSLNMMGYDYCVQQTQTLAPSVPIQTVFTVYGTAKDKATGTYLNQGSLRILIKNETGTIWGPADFNNIISKGKFNVTLGAVTQLYLIPKQNYNMSINVTNQLTAPTTCTPPACNSFEVPFSR